MVYYNIPGKQDAVKDVTLDEAARNARALTDKRVSFEAMVGFRSPNSNLTANLLIIPVIGSGTRHGTAIAEMEVSKSSGFKLFELANSLRFHDKIKVTGKVDPQSNPNTKPKILVESIDILQREGIYQRIIPQRR